LTFTFGSKRPRLHSCCGFGMRHSWVGLSLGFLAACGGGGGDGPIAPDPLSVASVTFSLTELYVPLGETRSLTVTLKDRNGVVLTDRTVGWSTSAPGVATVSATTSSTATIAAVGVGSSTITVTSEGKSAGATVTVTSNVARFVSVAAGGAHTCALTEAGAAYCWGRDERGQLGLLPSADCNIDGTTFPCRRTPAAVGTSLVFKQLTGGDDYTCGLTADGTAYCWGGNSFGQLGDNSSIDRSSPRPVLTSLKFTTIDAGNKHTCALTSDGTAYCWGLNVVGQLGDGTTSDSSVPVAVSGGLKFQQIVAGGLTTGHTCALTTAGAAYCWGRNDAGQLGNNTSDPGLQLQVHSSPTAVAGGLTFATISTGLGRHNCALTAARAAFCWGDNTYGELGDESTLTRATPGAVSGGITFIQLSAGGFTGHTCGIAANGAAYCWGDNEVGALGNGTTLFIFRPFPVAGGLSFKSIDSGSRHTCGLTTDGILYCWGSNGAGQLGIGSTERQLAPARVLGQP